MQLRHCPHGAGAPEACSQCAGVTVIRVGVEPGGQPKHPVFRRNVDGPWKHAAAIRKAKGKR